MNAGISPAIVPWLLPLAVIAVAVWADGKGTASALLVCIVGVAYAWFPHHQVQGTRGGEVGEVFVAASGVYVTSLGGVTLVAAGLLYVLKSRQTLPHRAVHNDTPEG